MMNLLTMNDKPDSNIIEAIEAKHGCESCGIMITALLLNTDFIHNDPVLAKKAHRAILLLNDIAKQINIKYL
jgi:hypothetical protein